MGVENTSRVIEKINKITMWQTEGFVDELICETDDTHRLLIAETKNDQETILRCLDCQYTREHITREVLDGILRCQEILIGNATG